MLVSWYIYVKTRRSFLPRQLFSHASCSMGNNILGLLSRVGNGVVLAAENRISPVNRLCNWCTFNAWMWLSHITEKRGCEWRRKILVLKYHPTRHEHWQHVSQFNNYTVAWTKATPGNPYASDLKRISFADNNFCFGGKSRFFFRHFTSINSRPTFA